MYTVLFSLFNGDRILKIG